MSLSSISGILVVFLLIKSISYVISISVLSLNQSRLWVFFISCYTMSLIFLAFVFLEEFVCHFCMLSTCKELNLSVHFAYTIPASLALCSLIELGACK